MNDSPVMVTESDLEVESTRPGETSQVHWLSRLIEQEPDAPVHYLLRGEEWVISGRWAEARADLEQARDLAEERLAQSAWGYIYQAYIDRAEAGLRRCPQLP
jgi:hypothetical protein